jgi:hypothetical protein
LNFILFPSSSFLLFSGAHFQFDRKLLQLKIVLRTVVCSATVFVERYSLGFHLSRSVGTQFQEKFCELKKLNFLVAVSTAGSFYTFGNSISFLIRTFEKNPKLRKFTGCHLRTVCSQVYVYSFCFAIKIKIMDLFSVVS